MRVDRLTLTAGLALTLAACTTEPVEDAAVATATTDVASVRAEIERANARMGEFFARSAFDSMAATYSEDALVMPPNMPAVQGTDSIAAMFATAKREGVQRVDIRTTDLEVAGDLAVETGTYTMTIRPTGGTEITEEGKFIGVWKRQPDGSWRLFRDILNANTPPPGR